MNFLSNVLREDGGFEYKKAIVDSILILIKDIPDAKEPGLGHLCEFIEVRSQAGSPGWVWCWWLLGCTHANLMPKGTHSRIVMNARLGRLCSLRSLQVLGGVGSGAGNPSVHT